ncbi:MAG TPA: ABC transporter substrate-binding protein [Solirubrobacterales bacterium]|jgi:ABC-type branched-subunit amino acid transport system substrate-binding protein
MSREVGRRLASLSALALFVAVLTGCSGSKQPFRIGVIADCVGINRPLHNVELSGAELPLLQRGAHLQGDLAADGISSTEIAGRTVELVPGCTEIYEFSTLTTEVRRLIEREHVDAIVAASGGADEVVLREVARRYPKVVFLPVVHGPREVTLHNPPTNLFRVVGDHGQGVAGLATYAYRELGWRRAAVVLANWDTGWGERDAFVAEFCSLGGRIESQLALDPPFDPAGRDVADVPMGVDGVAVFAPQFFGPAGFLQRLAARNENPAQHIVVGPSIADDPTLLGSTRGALTGVVGSSFADTARMNAYLATYAQAFPGTPTGVAGGELVTGYRDAVEALVTALEKAERSSARREGGRVVGPLFRGSAPVYGTQATLRPFPFPAALASLDLDLLGGPVRLDDHRQAVVSTSLVRIEPPGTGEPGTAHVRTIGDVDQSVGGLLPPSSRPSANPAKCRSGQRPPPWAD